jgi:hypothetical protein
VTKDEATRMMAAISTVITRIEANTDDMDQVKVHDMHLLIPLYGLQEMITIASETEEEREERELQAEQEWEYNRGRGL